MRLGFYENWLSVEGLRDGTIGLGPLSAVLSFLRQEEGEAYRIITTRAGEYAAEWTVQAMAPPHRAFMSSTPEWLRQRLVLRLARQIVRSSHPGSRAVSRLRQGTADVEVTASIFCTVREPVLHPLCGFYASALTRLFRALRLERPGRGGGVSRNWRIDLRAEGGAFSVMISQACRRPTRRNPPRRGAD